MCALDEAKARVLLMRDPSFYEIVCGDFNPDDILRAHEGSSLLETVAHLCEMFKLSLSSTKPISDEDEKHLAELARIMPYMMD